MNQQQYHDHGMGGYPHHPEGDQSGMYAQFTQYDNPMQPPPQHMAYQSYYPMHDGMDPNSHPPDLHISGPSPTGRLRARRAGERPTSLEVAVHPYSMDGRVSPACYSPSMQGQLPVPPPKSSLRGKTVEEEEARKARKREMGRERQRRKRLRDKAKREAQKAMDTHGPGSSTSTLLASRSAGDRSSFTSVSSYEGPSSTSTTYSNLPPMSVTISPSNSFGMSSSASLSDVSSPGHLSPTMSGFASDSSWQEHTAVFGNLSLSGDATVRASKPRATSANLSSVAGSRRDSGADVPPMPSHLAPSNKRRKSDSQDQRPDPVGLGVVMGNEGDDGAWHRTRSLRRTESVPEGIQIDPALTGGDGRGSTPPPDMHGRPKPSENGTFFASTVVMALSQSQWASVIHNRLGMETSDIERMGPDLAAAYDRFRLEYGMSRVTLDAHRGVSPAPGSPSSRAFATPASSRAETSTESPSNSSSHSHHNMHPLIQRPGSNPVGLTAAGRLPETPQSKPQGAGNGSSSSTTASPAQPTLQTPASSNHGMFHQPDYNQQWGQPQINRMYEDQWRGQYPPHLLASPMPNDGKHGSAIPPPPLHAPMNAPAPALNSPVTVQPGVFQAANAPRTFPPGSSGHQHHHQHQPGNVPIYYNHQMPMQGVHGSPSNAMPSGDEMVQLGP